MSEDEINLVFAEHAEYMRSTGILTAFVGPMFASKTTSLLKEFENRDRSVLIKVQFDDRYSSNSIVSHDGKSLPAESIEEWNESLEESFDNFFFDEIQFFSQPYFRDNIIEVVKGLLKRGKNVWIAGLDMDYTGTPFFFSPLLAMADVVHKLKARCFVCGNPAGKTYKLSGTGGSVELGAGDKYEARCNEHWVNRT